MSLRFSVLILIFVVMPTVAAFDVSPANPSPGDELTITGTAAPGEEVRLRSSFEMTIPVEGGRYEYVVEGVEVPQKPNRLSVVATNVDTLTAGVKMGMWITMPVKTSGGTASVSKSDVPPGRYTLKIYGDAVPGAPTVSIKVDAETAAVADSAGEYELAMDTSGVPAGEYRIRAAGEERVITIGGTTAEPSPSDPAGASGRLTSSMTRDKSTSTDGIGEEEARAPEIPDPYYRQFKKADVDNVDDIVRYIGTSRNRVAGLDVFEKAAFYEHYLTGVGFNVSFAYTEEFGRTGADHLWLLVTTKKGEVIEVDPSYANVGSPSLLPLGPEYAHYDQRFEDIYEASDGLGIERLAWWTDETAWGSPAPSNAVEEVVSVAAGSEGETPKEDKGLISWIRNLLLG